MVCVMLRSRPWSIAGRLVKQLVQDRGFTAAELTIGALFALIVIGSLYGSGHPLVDIPRLVDLYRNGKLKLRELVTHSYHLDEVNEALNTLAAGTDARGIIEW